MRQIYTSLWLTLALIFAAPAGSQTSDAAADLERFLAEADTLSADFTQVLMDGTGAGGEHSGGRFYVSRPGRFRWEYTTPAEQLVVSDGERLWMYDADLEQVTVRSVDESLDGTPAMLLSGKGRLEDSFRTGPTYVEEGLAWVELIPLTERPEFKGLRVGMSDGVIGAMEVIDNLEQVTRIEFRAVELHAELAAELFRFEPPEGVDVIGQEGF